MWGYKCRRGQVIVPVLLMGGLTLLIAAVLAANTETILTILGSATLVLGHILNLP